MPNMYRSNIKLIIVRSYCIVLLCNSCENFKVLPRVEKVNDYNGDSIMIDNEKNDTLIKNENIIIDRFAKKEEFVENPNNQKDENEITENKSYKQETNYEKNNNRSNQKNNINREARKDKNKLLRGHLESTPPVFNRYSEEE